jgi:hypothetical protein
MSKVVVNGVDASDGAGAAELNMPDSKNKFVVQRPDGSWCIVETDGEHPDKGGIVSSEQDISAEEAKQLMSKDKRE